ncbi:polysaccharide deacetylase family protein [Clostridiaceae bacterium M8S5]|nr:polysaccharide deacetylase family protein [Clostridiaceae bacterium M8S5]
MKKVKIYAIACIVLLIFIFNSNIFGQADNKGVKVLMYHHLIKNQDNKYKDNCAILDVELFEEHMKILKDNNVNVIDIEELEEFLDSKKELPPNSVLITFDDGYKSNVTHAYPILKKYGFKATIFLVTAYSPKDTEKIPGITFPHISFKEIEETKDVFTYASHTHDFHKMDENKKGYLVCKTEEEIQKDLQKSIDLLKTKYLAYPYGQYNEDTKKILKKLGITMAFTVKSGSVNLGDDKLEINRFPITPHVSAKKFKKIINLD